MTKSEENTQKPENEEKQDMHEDNTDGNDENVPGADSLDKEDGFDKTPTRARDDDVDDISNYKQDEKDEELLVRDRETEEFLRQYEPVSSEGEEFIKKITCSLADQDVRKHLSSIKGGSAFNTVWRQYLQSVIDGVMVELRQKSTEGTRSISEVNQKTLDRIVTDSIQKQQAKICIQKVFLNVMKDRKMSATKGQDENDDVFGLDMRSMKQAWSTEALVSDTVVSETSENDILRFHEKIDSGILKTPSKPVTFKDASLVSMIGQPGWRKKTTQAVTKAEADELGQLSRSKYQPHTDLMDYKIIPPLDHLPLYPQPPFPSALPPSDDLLRKRTVRVGYTCVCAPSFPVSEILTHAHSKLTRYYNVMKCETESNWIYAIPRSKK